MRRKILLSVFCLQFLIGGATDYFWVGGGGSWTDLNHWALSSGGSVHPGVVPSSSDNVFFDVNSGFTISSSQVQVNVTANCRNITVLGSVVAPVFNGIGSLNIYGSSFWQNGMVYSVNNTFYKSSAAETITTNGVVMVGLRIYLDGPGSWTLIDDFIQSGNGASVFILTQGTLNTNNKSFTVDAFSDMGTGSKIINLGSSPVYVKSGAFSSAQSGTVLKAGTSHIHMESTTSLGILAAKSDDIYYDVTFEAPEVTSAPSLLVAGAIPTPSVRFNNVEFKGNGNLNANGTFNSLILAPGKTYTFQNGKTQTINGFFSALTPVCGGSAVLKSSILGTQSTINCPSTATVLVGGAVISDLIATGGASFIANNSVDGGNNTGWTINPPSGQNLYWVGGSGNWNDAAHWSATSGGTGGYCVPGPADNVFFDAGSGFSSSGNTVTVKDNGFCRDITVSGAATPPTITGITGSLYIYGSSVWQSGMTYNVAFTIYKSSGPATITSNAVEMAGIQITLNGTGSWTLQDDFTEKGSSAFSLIQGTLNTNNYRFTINSFSDASSIGSRTIKLGSSQVYVTGGGFISFKTSNLNTTLDAGTSHIHFSKYTYLTVGINGIAAKSGDVYYDVTFEDASPVVTYGGLIYSHAGTVRFNNVEFRGHAYIKGNNIFNNLTLAAGKVYSFENGYTQTINGIFTAQTPACSGWAILKSIFLGSQATISCPSTATVLVSGAVVSDLKATGGATFNANSSIDNGNNTGWIFPTTLTGTNLYWVGGPGNWNEAVHWSATSGGAGGACIPGPADNVFFDAGSGLTSSGNTVTIDGNGLCRNITVSGALTAPVISGPGSLYIYGSSVWQSGMTYGVAYTYYKSSGPATITSNGVATGGIYVKLDGAGSWTLQDDYVCSATGLGLTTFGLTLTRGTFNTNSHAVNLTYFGDEGSLPKTLNLGSSIITVTSPYGFKTTQSSTTVYAGTSHIRFTSGTANGYGLQPKDGDHYYDITFESGTSPGNIDSHTGAVYFNKVEFKGNGTIKGNNEFKQLILTAGNTYQLQNGNTQTISGQLYASGNPCYILYLKSTTSGSQANLCINAGTTTFDYANVRDINATCQPLNFEAHSTNEANNTNISFAPYSTGAIYGFGPDQALPCTSYPVTLTTSGFYPNPYTTFTWQDGSTANTFTASAPGTFSITVNYGKACVINDAITLGFGPLTAALVPQGEKIANLNNCTANNIIYYTGDGQIVPKTKAILSVNPNGNTWSPSNITVDNAGTYTGGGGTFSNSGAGYYQSTDGANTLRITKRLHSIEAPGSYTANGGVIVRVYYEAADTMAMRTDPLPGSASIAYEGWFKHSSNTAPATVAAMNPLSFATVQMIKPINYGIDNGVRYVEFKVASFSTFGYLVASNTTVLPVKLQSFEGSPADCSARLFWKTAAEENFSHFIVEYSSNGTGFVAVGTVPSKHNSSGAAYAFAYAQPAGKGFYRLKMVDIDGRTEYSSTVSLTSNCARTEVSILPNPVKNIVKIRGVQQGDLILLYGANGQVLINKVAANNYETIRMGKYASGVYTLFIRRQDGEIIRTKLIRE
jgi:hypothetical protein